MYIYLGCLKTMVKSSRWMAWPARRLILSPLVGEKLLLVIQNGLGLLL
jgi:hypothetical protein